jgi:hypothetical protein
MGQAGEALQATVWSCGPTRNPHHPTPHILPHRRSHGLAPPTRGPASRSLHPARDSAMAMAPSSSFETGLIPTIILLRFTGSMGLPEVARPRYPVFKQGPQGGPHAEPDVEVEVLRPAPPRARRRAGHVHLDYVLQVLPHHSFFFAILSRAKLAVSTFASIPK